MAVIKGQMKIHNGAGFDVAHNETSAEVVKYSDTTVAAVLGGLSSTYVAKDGAKVLSTNDFTNAYKNTIDNLSGTYVQQVSGKDLSTNDFTNAYKNTIDGLSSTYVQQVSGKDLSTNDFTNAYKTAIDGLSSTYATKSEIASVYKPKGSVANFAALPANADEGDVYNVLAAGGTDENNVAIKAGDNVVKTATGWDVLSGTVDLTDYVQKDGLKVLSTNDFTDALKTKLEGLSAVDTSEFLQVYVGNSAPTDTNVIWFDTSAYV